MLLFQVMGLDCEWCFEEQDGTSKRHKVALLQLATHSGLCLLIRLFKMSHDIPHDLRVLLQDRKYARFIQEITQALLSPLPFTVSWWEIVYPVYFRIWKVGVGVMSDAAKLQKDYGLACLGCIELGPLADRVASRIRFVVVVYDPAFTTLILLCCNFMQMILWSQDPVINLSDIVTWFTEYSKLLLTPIIGKHCLNQTVCHSCNAAYLFSYIHQVFGYFPADYL